MNKLDLVNAVSEACSISKKDADAAITALLLEVGKALERKEEVKLSGFGTFLVKDRKGRVGTIPELILRLIFQTQKLLHLNLANN